MNFWDFWSIIMNIDRKEQSTALTLENKAIHVTELSSTAMTGRGIAMTLKQRLNDTCHHLFSKQILTHDLYTRFPHFHDFLSPVHPHKRDVHLHKFSIPNGERSAPPKATIRIDTKCFPLIQSMYDWGLSIPNQHNSLIE